jgi:hypothetical protein
MISLVRPRRSFNPKRRIAPRPASAEEFQRLAKLAERVRSGGNPEHKRNPGDFGLTPPNQPRQGKTLCDGAGIFRSDIAENLVKEGMRRGLVSEAGKGSWPKNVWAVSDAGVALEAMLENAEAGTYHGYPMPDEDPLAEEVRERWRAS